MRPVYCISLDGRSIHIEEWSGWAAFDARPPAPAAGPADLAYAVGDRVNARGTTEARFEIQRVRVNNGLASEARQIVALDVARWEAAGARTVGLFEIVHGNDLPAMLLVLEWNGMEEAVRGLHAVETEMTHTARHRQQRLDTGRSAIRATSRTIGCTLSMAAAR